MHVWVRKRGHEERQIFLLVGRLRPPTLRYLEWGSFNPVSTRFPPVLPPIRYDVEIPYPNSD